MYDQLKDRVADLLRRPRPLKPQTERHLTQYLAEHTADIHSFLLAAAEVLEEHEVDVLFAPQFTPTLDEQAEVSDVLYHWRPNGDEIERLVPDLCQTVAHAVVLLPDDTEAKLTVHEVMVDRLVRLLRLEQAPAANVTAALRDALPEELWTVAAALLRQRGFTPDRQAWFARFVNHMAGRHPVSRGLLATAADFVADQPTLQRQALLNEARALSRAAEGSAAYAEGGHTYWSPDVAQHHQYRGQGKVDQSLVQQRQDEADWFTTIEADLQTYDENAN